MVKGFIIFIASTLLLISNVSIAQQDAEFYKNTVNQYCVGCHNDTLKTVPNCTQIFNFSHPSFFYRSDYQLDMFMAL